KQVWNDTIERDLDDVLSIQSEIARALADGINVAVTPDERVRLTARQTVNTQAYKLFLLGRQQWNNRTQPALTQALDYFKQAIALSPNYATAHQWYGNYLSDMGREEEGLREIRRALELDPLSAIISRDVAWPLFFSRRYDEAIHQLQLTLAQHAGYLPAE